MFGREEPDCSIQRLGGRAAGRLQTSRSRSTFAGREKDRGNAKLLRREENNYGLEERGKEKGREGRVSNAEPGRKERASFIFLGKAEGWARQGAGSGRAGRSHTGCRRESGRSEKVQEEPSSSEMPGVARLHVEPSTLVLRPFSRASGNLEDGQYLVIYCVLSVAWGLHRAQQLGLTLLTNVR